MMKYESCSFINSLKLSVTILPFPVGVIFSMDTADNDPSILQVAWLYSGDFIEKNWYHVAKTCSWIYWYTHETIGKNYLKWEGRQHKKQWTYTMQLCKMIVHIANDCIYLYIYTNVMLNAHWQRHCWLISLLNLVY